MAEHVEMLLTAAAINTRLDEVAKQIKTDYADKNITLVCTLKGGVLCMTDLARRLDNNVEMDFIRVSSYGGTESTGTVQLDMSLSTDGEGKHILLVEDIVDTGHTLVFLRKYFENMNPASFKVFALLDKPERRIDHSAKYDYLGFEIPDQFVVGYGLDYNQRYRNLPYIGVLSLGE